MGRPARLAGARDCVLLVGRAGGRLSVRLEELSAKSGPAGRAGLRELTRAGGRGVLARQLCSLCWCCCCCCCVVVTAVGVTCQQPLTWALRMAR